MEEIKKAPCLKLQGEGVNAILKDGFCEMATKLKSGKKINTITVDDYGEVYLLDDIKQNE